MDAATMRLEEQQVRRKRSRRGFFCGALLFAFAFSAAARQVFHAAWANSTATVIAKAPVSKASKPEATTTLAAVGDVMLARGVARKMTRFGPGYPFEKAAPLLLSADIAFANLECPIAAGGAPVVKRVVFRARPATARSLAKAGVDIVSLANNHTLDYGPRGLAETMSNLRRNGVRWCGGGRSRDEAEAATVIQRNGIKVAFVGFCEFAPQDTSPRHKGPVIAVAPNTSAMSNADVVERVRRAVVRAQRQADVVVASFHWGVEYAPRPEAAQKTLALAAVAAGAGLVLGHHSHVLQGFQVVPQNAGRNARRALIAFSLGNFVFDPSPSRGAAPAETVVLRCVLSKRGVLSAQVVPMRIEACRPRAATAPETRRILTRLAQLSRALGTQMTQGRIHVEDEAVVGARAAVR